MEAVATAAMDGCPGTPGGVGFVSGEPEGSAANCAMDCFLPRSKRIKSSFLRFSTGLFCASRTTTRTTTRLLVTLIWNGAWFAAGDAVTLSVVCADREIDVASRAEIRKLLRKTGSLATRRRIMPSL